MIISARERYKLDDSRRRLEIHLMWEFRGSEDSQPRGNVLKVNPRRKRKERAKRG